MLGTRSPLDLAGLDDAGRIAKVSLSAPAGLWLWPPRSFGKALDLSAFDVERHLAPSESRPEDAEPGGNEPARREERPSGDNWHAQHHCSRSDPHYCSRSEASDGRPRAQDARHRSEGQAQSTSPICAVDAPRASCMSDVRVTQDAIPAPKTKKSAASGVFLPRGDEIANPSEACARAQALVQPGRSD